MKFINRKILVLSVAVIMIACAGTACSNNGSEDNSTASLQTENISVKNDIEEENSAEKKESSIASGSLNVSTGTGTGSEESNAAPAVKKRNTIYGPWTYKKDDSYINMNFSEDGTMTADASDLATNILGSWILQGRKLTINLSGSEHIYTFRDEKLTRRDDTNIVFVRGTTSYEDIVKKDSNEDEFYAGITVNTAKNTVQAKMGAEYSIISISKGVTGSGKEAWVATLVKADGSDSNLTYYYVSDVIAEQGNVVEREESSAADNGSKTKKEVVEDMLSFVGNADGISAVVDGDLTVRDGAFKDPVKYYKVDLRLENGNSTSHIDFYYTPVSKNYRIFLDSQSFKEKYGIE